MEVPIRFYLRLPVFALLLSLIACAATKPEYTDDGMTAAEKLERLGYRQGEAVRSVNKPLLDNWIYLDDRNILIETGQRPRYLFEFSDRCYHLTPASTLAFTTTVDSVTSLDKIVVMAGDSWQSECLIKDIYKLEPLG